MDLDANAVQTKAPMWIALRFQAHFTSILPVSRRAFGQRPFATARLDRTYGRKSRSDTFTIFLLEGVVHIWTSGRNRASVRAKEPPWTLQRLPHTL